MLLEPELATRMAALLVLQQAHQRAPGCLAATVPDLVALLGSSDARVRGDVADLLGTIGDARALEPLRALCEDADEEVAEAAREAWGSLQARGDGA
jgi:HEAT repeat protein